MSRRSPKSFAHWAIGVVGAVVTALIFYQLRMYRAEHRLEHDLSHILRQLQHKSAPQSPVAHWRSPEEVAAHQEAARRRSEIDRRAAEELAKSAAQDRLKEVAWSEYFTPTQRCQIPESPRMVEVCQANEAKLRARFEADWAAGKRT